MKHALALCSVLLTMAAAPPDHPTERFDVATARKKAHACLRIAVLASEVATCLATENEQLDRALADYVAAAAAEVATDRSERLAADQAAWLRYRDKFFAPTPGAGPERPVAERNQILWQRYDEVMSRFDWVAELTSEYQAPRPFESLPQPEQRRRVLDAQRAFFAATRDAVGSTDAESRRRVAAGEMKATFTSVLDDYFEDRIATLQEAGRRRARLGQSLWREYRQNVARTDREWLSITRARFVWVARLGRR